MTFKPIRQEKGRKGGEEMKEREKNAHESESAAFVEIAGWPGTVSRERMEGAARRLFGNLPPQTGQEHHDATNMLLTVTLTLKGSEMITELDAMPQGQGQEREIIRRALEMALEGDTEESIGAIILSPAKDQAERHLPRHRDLDSPP